MNEEQNSTETAGGEYPKKVRLVYIGFCRLEGGKKGHEFARLLEGDKLGQHHYFARPLRDYIQPGGIVETDEVEPNRFNRGAKWIGHYPDQKQRVKWIATARAEEAAFDAEKRADKEAKANPLFESLEPIRAAYKKLPAPARRMLLADVLRVITG